MAASQQVGGGGTDLVLTLPVVDGWAIFPPLISFSISQKSHHQSSNLIKTTPPKQLPKPISPLVYQNTLLSLSQPICSARYRNPITNPQTSSKALL
jgi:hypothetical protein